MVTIPSRRSQSQDPGDEYAFFRSILNEINVSELIQRLEEYRWTGRQGYSPESMWRAVLLRYLLHLRYTRDLIVQLRTSQELRSLCGFDDEIPSESTFSRFFRRLLNHQDLVDEALHRVIDQTGVDLPVFGRAVALDSTDIEAYGKYRKEKRCADPDAKWGRRTSKDPQVKDQLFYGYKLHLACDAAYGVPLGYMVLPANASDSPQLPKLFDQIKTEHPALTLRYAIADRGYDGAPNYRYLKKNEIGAVIAIRDTRNGDGSYSLKGIPRCIGGQDMHFLGTDRKKGHRFRCPAGGCELQDVVQFSRHCDSEILRAAKDRSRTAMGRAVCPGESALAEALRQARLRRTALRLSQADSDAGHALVSGDPARHDARRAVPAGVHRNDAGSTPSKASLPTTCGT